MNRIELYIDKNDRLTIDFFYNHTDEFSMSRFKGKDCYPVISQISQSNLLEVNQYEDKDELVLLYNECIIRVNDCSQTFEKIGTGPLKKCVYKFYEDEKKAHIKPKKVSRKNRHVGCKIIATSLVLSLLGGVIANEFFNLKQQKTPVPENTLTSTEEDIGKTSDHFTIEDYNQIETDEFDKESNELSFFVEYENRSETEKAHITKAYYGDVIERYAKMYGLDPQILIGIATQERGVHSEKKDLGGATGLMQIQNSVWSGEKITAYNYQTNTYETIVVSEEKLSDVFYNIKVGCMYFQNCMDYMKNNVFAAIQCYNMGYGNMKKILNEYSKESGKTIEEILSDVLDDGWLKYRNIIKVGDDKYLEHVLSWINDEFVIRNVQYDGKIINLNVTNQNEIKNMSYN